MYMYIYVYIYVSVLLKLLVSMPSSCNVNSLHWYTAQFGIQGSACIHLIDVFFICTYIYIYIHIHTCILYIYIYGTPPHMPTLFPLRCHGRV